MSSYVKVSTYLPTAAVMACSLAMVMDEMPEINIEQSQQINKTHELASFGNAQTHYKVIDENFESLQKIESIQNFASNLLENIQDLNPEFSKVIDENYWDLI